MTKENDFLPANETAINVHVPTTKESGDILRSNDPIAKNTEWQKHSGVFVSINDYQPTITPETVRMAGITEQDTERTIYSGALSAPGAIGEKGNFWSNLGKTALDTAQDIPIIGTIFGERGTYKARQALGATIVDATPDGKGQEYGRKIASQASRQLQLMRERDGITDEEADTWGSAIGAGSVSMAEFVVASAMTGGSQIIPSALAGIQAYVEGAGRDVEEYIQETGDVDLEKYEGSVGNLATNVASGAVQGAIEGLVGKGGRILDTGKIATGNAYITFLARWFAESGANALEEKLQTITGETAELIKGNSDLKEFFTNSLLEWKDAGVGAILGGTMSLTGYNRSHIRGVNKLKSKIQELYPEIQPAIAERAAEEMMTAGETAVVQGASKNIDAVVAIADPNSELTAIVKKATLDTINAKIQDSDGFADGDMSEEERIRFADTFTRIVVSDALRESVEQGIPLTESPLMKAVGGTEGLFFSGRDYSALNDYLAERIDDAIRERWQKAGVQLAEEYAEFRRTQQDTLETAKKAEKVAQEAVSEIQDIQTKLGKNEFDNAYENTPIDQKFGYRQRINIGDGTTIRIAKASGGKNKGKFYANRTDLLGNIEILTEDGWESHQGGTIGFVVAKTFDTIEDLQKAISDTYNVAERAEQPTQLFQESFDIADENARLDDIYPEYKGETIEIEVLPEPIPKGETKEVTIGKKDWETPHITIWERSEYANLAMPTIVDFFVPEEERGTGKGKALLKEAVSKYKNLSGQFSSKKAAKIFYDLGGRLAIDKNATLEDIYKIIDRDSSVRLIKVETVVRPTKNSDGQPIAKSEPALRNFWNWFGDSKVVDEDGRPLVVYHGTEDEFDTFDIEKSNNGVYGKGFYFAYDERIPKGHGDIVMPAYLKIENPFMASGRTTVKEIRDNLKSEKYDGFLSSDEVYVKKNTQIKSTQNRGTFSPDTGNIYHQGNIGTGLRGKDARAAYDPVLDRLILGDNWDATSMLHELAHRQAQRIYHAVHSGQASPELEKRWLAIEDWLGVPENYWKSHDFLGRQYQEQFARAYEKFIYDGKFETPELKTLFKDLNKQFREIYEDLEYKYFDLKKQLSPELLELFNRVESIEKSETIAESTPEKLVEKGIITESEATELSSEIEASKAIESLLPTTKTETNDITKFNTGKTVQSETATKFEEEHGITTDKERGRRELFEKVKPAALEFVRNNEALAMDIVSGKATERDGLFRQDLYKALETYYTENDDIDGLLSLAPYTKVIGQEASARLGALRNVDGTNFLETLDAINDKIEKKNSKQIEKETSRLESELETVAFDWDESIDEQFMKEQECK